MRVPRAFRLGVTVVLSGVLARGCFDSDEKPEVLTTEDTTTGGVDPTTTGSTTMLDFSSSGDPDQTCRDAIDCAAGCTLVAINNDPDAELVDTIITCILECGPGLNEAEAEKVLRLIDCVTIDCVDRGLCDIFLPPPGTSSGGNGTTGGSGGSSTSDGEPPVDPVLQCQTCLISGVTVEQPSDDFACAEQAIACM